MLYLNVQMVRTSNGAWLTASGICREDYEADTSFEMSTTSDHLVAIEA